LECRSRFATGFAFSPLPAALRSIAIDADDPDTVASGLSIDRPAFSLTFKLLGDPAEQPTTLLVGDGKFWKQ
jgi:hypothetical protein